MLRNAAVIAGVIAISSAYLWVSPSFVPAEYALVVNFVAVPFALGMLAGYLLVGGLVFRLLVLLLIPIAHVLIFGGDPAKQGLENLVALVELVPLCIGCLIAHMLLGKKTGSAPAPNV